MMDQKTTVAELKQYMKAFIDERDWGQYQTPKNISMALAIEAAELMEHFMWLSGPESKEELEKNREAIEHEVADIFAFLLSFAAHYNVDLSRAYERKMMLNAQKYSVEKAKGRYEKYNKL